MEPSNNTISIFIAYSREDREYLEKLRRHIKVLERTDLVDEIWYDGMIEAGLEWEKNLKSAMRDADLILLLISIDFIASDSLYEEMQHALSMHEEGNTHVVPILVRDCVWEDTEFAALPVLPANGQPLASSHWESEDHPYMLVTERVKELLESLAQEGEPIPQKIEPAEEPKDSISSDFFAAIRTVLEGYSNYPEFHLDAEGIQNTVGKHKADYQLKEKEEIFGFLDATMFGSGDKGLVITERGISGRVARHPVSGILVNQDFFLSWEEIKGCECGNYELAANFIDLGGKFFFTPGHADISVDTLLQLLTELRKVVQKA